MYAAGPFAQRRPPRCVGRVGADQREAPLAAKKKTGKRRGTKRSDGEAMPLFDEPAPKKKRPTIARSKKSAKKGVGEASKKTLKKPAKKRSEKDFSLYFSAPRPWSWALTLRI